MIPTVLPLYNRTPYAFERGEGAYVYTTEGERYLDFMVGIGVSALGHCHPELVKVLSGQAEKLWHVSNIYRIPGQEELAEKLLKYTFAETAFFCNSGTEAVEFGLKAIRKYHKELGRPEKYRVIAFQGAYHGRTLGSLAISSKDRCREGYDPMPDGFDIVPWGDMQALRNAITPATGGIIIEPIRGDGGICVVPETFLRELRALCDRLGLLLMFDEIQCGMGRSGYLYAHEAAGISPDLMATAKGFGGGFPVAACLATAEAAKGMTVGTHGTTYGGNPLAMAVASRVMDLVADPKMLAHVRSISAYFWERLETLQAAFPHVIKAVEGRGLMIGLNLAVPNIPFVEKLRSEKLLTAAAGNNSVRLLPPLIITREHVNEAMAALEAACHHYVIEAETV